MVFDCAADQMPASILAQASGAKHSQIVAFGATASKDHFTGFALPPVREAVTAVIEMRACGPAQLMDA
jgi:hypothetical protein